MEKISVRIIHYPPEIVLKEALEKPYRNQFNEKNWRKIARKVLHQMKHESVAEHLHVSFEVLGFSRMVLQEWARHRLANLTVESSRFTLEKIVKEGKYDPVTPPQLRECDIYREWKKISLEYLLKAIEVGYKNDTLKYFLTENFRTNLVWTINVRSLWNFLSLRMGNGSNKPHFEIKHVANLVYKELKRTEIGWLFEEHDPFQTDVLADLENSSRFK